MRTASAAASSPFNTTLPPAESTVTSIPAPVTLKFDAVSDVRILPVPTPVAEMFVNAPDDDRHLVLHPNAWSQFISIGKFYNSATFPQQKALAKYQIAEVYGVQTYKSNNISSSSLSARNLLFHREAFGLARSIQIDVMMQDMARAGRKEIVAYTLYGKGIIRNTFAAVILS